MALLDKKVYVNYDMLGNLVKNFGIDRSATAPDTDLQAGRIYYDTTFKALGVYNGATWEYIYGIDDNLTTTTNTWSAEKITSYIASRMGSLEWQNSALSYITDVTLPPPSESTGNRYILAASLDTPNAGWGGAPAGTIVEFNGTEWVSTKPSTGTFISVDDEATGIYYWGGTAWNLKVWENTQTGLGVTVGANIASPYGVDLEIATVALGSDVDTTDFLAINDSTSSATNQTVKVTVGDFATGIIDTADGVLKQDPTSKKIQVSDASDTQKGAVELATEIEVKQGIETTLAVTPAGLASYVRVESVYIDVADWTGSAGDYSKTLTAGTHYHLGNTAIADIISVTAYVNDVEVEMGVDRSVLGEVTIFSSSNEVTFVEILGKGYTA